MKANTKTVSTGKGPKGQAKGKAKPAAGKASSGGVIGHPPTYRLEFAKIAKAMCKLGATDYELAEEFGVKTSTIWRWRSKHKEFRSALLEGKEAFDDRAERSLAQKAIGYTYNSEKVFQFEGRVVRASTVEHVPPDVGALKMWLGNRRPDKWKEKQEVNLTGGEAFIEILKQMSEVAAA